MIDPRLVVFVRDIELWRTLAPAMRLAGSIDNVSVDATALERVHERLSTDGTSTCLTAMSCRRRGTRATATDFRTFRCDASAIRALSAKTGTVLGRTHHLLHWGADSSERAAGPRVSISMEFQRGDIPLVGEALAEDIPPFAERLRLIGLQIQRHHHMEPAAAGLGAQGALLAPPS